MTTPDVAALAARLTFHAEVWRKLHENFPAVAADLDAAAALLAAPEPSDEAVAEIVADQYHVGIDGRMEWHLSPRELVMLVRAARERAGRQT